MKIRFKPTSIVLAMLCAMYFITYVDRVNIGTAASGIQHDLHLSNAELGLAFSAFAWPYLFFQVGGGWVADRLGARRTLFWCGLIWGAATILTGFAGSLTTLFLVRVLLGVGRAPHSPPPHGQCKTGCLQNSAGWHRGLRIPSHGSATPSRRRSSHSSW